MPEDSRHIITEHLEFYKATAKGETRYYAVGNPSAREAAIGYDEGNDPSRNMGFAVYDVSISTGYAIDLFPSKSQAEAFTAQPSPTVADDAHAAPAEHPAAYTAEQAEPHTPSANKNKKRGRKTSRS